MFYHALSVMPLFLICVYLCGYACIKTSKRGWWCVLTAGQVIRPWTDNGVDQSSLGGPLRDLLMYWTSVLGLSVCVFNQL